MAMLSRCVALSVSLTRKVSRCRAEGGETEAFKLLFEGFEPPAAGLPRFFRLVQGQLDEIVGFGPADLDVQSVCMLDVVSEMVEKGQRVEAELTARIQEERMADLASRRSPPKLIRERAPLQPAQQQPAAPPRGPGRGSEARYSRRLSAPRLGRRWTRRERERRARATARGARWTRERVLVSRRARV